MKTNAQEFEGLNKLSMRQEARRFIQSKYSHMNSLNAKLFIINIFDNNLGTQQIKASKSFIIRNTKRLVEDEKHKNNYFFERNYVKEIMDEMLEKYPKLFVKHIELVENDDPKWLSRHIDENTHEVSMDFTYEEMRKYLCDAGPETNFVVDFKGKKPTILVNEPVMQIIKLKINGEGEPFHYPLTYSYFCKECNVTTSAKSYEVCSSKKTINCPNIIDLEDKNGHPKTKKCNAKLYPDNDMIESKIFHVTNGLYDDGYGSYNKTDIISEKRLPLGDITAAVILIPREYGGMFICVVDYKPIERKELIIEENLKQHRMFSLISSIDKHIYDVTGYKHFGYLPMKMSMLLQHAARNTEKVPNNFNIELIGGKATGKTTFSDYWSSVLYGDRMKSVKINNISIPKLRGTTEKLKLFNQDITYASQGWLGQYDLIIIDELKENENLKDYLKPLLRSPTYSFAKQGGSGIDYIRTSQMIVTENINPIHLKGYKKKVRELYCGNSSIITDDTEDVPAWDEGWDIECPLHEIDNDYLRNVVYQVRQYYETTGSNWIDGSELASDDRFVFYFFIQNSEPTEEMMSIVLQNQKNNANDYNIIDLVRRLGAHNLKDDIIKTKTLTGTNEDEYYFKVTNLIKLYNKDLNARTITDYVTMLKLIRMIDGREHYNDEDIKILQYLIENIKSKIELSSTNDFIIKGPKTIVID